MGAWRTCLAGLLLLTASRGGWARPSQGPGGEAEGLQRADASPACPHPLRRHANTREILGDWYVLEALFANVGNFTPITDVPCIRFSITYENDRMHLLANVLDEGTVRQDRNFTFTQSANGIWENVFLVTDTGFSLGFSSDENLLILCASNIIHDGDSDTVMSLVMGRSPLLDEGALAAIRSQGSETVLARPNLQRCTSPSEGA